MKIAHLADTHVDTRHRRWPTLQRSLATMVHQIRDENVDLIVHAGDLGEKNPSAQDLYSIATFLQDLAEIAPTIVVLGNHDARAHWDVLARVETRCPLRLVTTPETLCLLTDGALWNLEDLPEGELGAVQIIAHCMPWPSKGQLLSVLPEMPAPEQSDLVALECLRNIFRGWRSEREQYDVRSAPSILVGHLDLSGARGDQGQPLCTPDVSVSIYDIAEANTDITMLGHIHAQQHHEMVEPGILAWYSGSPCRLSWGEAGADSKGWVLHHIIGELPWWKVMAIPSPRLWTVEAEWRPRGADDLVLYGPDGSPMGVWAYDLDRGEEPGVLREQAQEGDELRYRYHVPEEQREAARMALDAELQRIWPGKRENVTVEPRIIPSAHARAPHLATEEDPVLQAMEYLKLERPDLSEAQRAELLPLLREAVQGVTP